MENELSVKDARKLATYYGRFVQREHELVQTEQERQINRDALSYCRWIILKRRIKK